MVEEKIVSILDQLEALAKQYSPEVLDSAIDVVRMTGVSTILEGFICGLAAIGCFFLAKHLVIFLSKKEKEGKYEDGPWELFKILCFIVGAVFVIIFTIACFANVFDTWSWIAIFDPKLALAKKVLML